MNSERLIGMAGKAIAKFARSHNTTCHLSYVQGRVIAHTKKEVKIKTPDCLIITRWQQQNGLDNSQWRCVGDALFEQYQKELLCQVHPKH